MDEVKMLVADESAVYRNIFISVASEFDGKVNVVCVSSGDAVIEQIKHSDFDIVVLDADLGDLDLLVTKIMSEISNAYILIMARPSSASDTLFGEMLIKGVAECITKPIFSSYDENVDTVRSKLSDIFDLLYKKSTNSKTRQEPATQNAEKGSINPFKPDIVLIASSTGGPPVLETILSKIEADFPAPVLIVQHMLTHFTDILAKNLDQKSKLRVKSAEAGETITAGTVYIAPGGTHMKLDSKGMIILDESPLVNGVRPSADVLFSSVAKSFPSLCVHAIILTGMGKDGENGIAALKDKGNCYCIAQSEETCVVYGMSRVVVERGHADLILGPDEITEKIERLFYESYQ